MNPIFGIEFSIEERAQSLSSVTLPRESDDVEIVCRALYSCTSQLNLSCF